MVDQRTLVSVRLATYNHEKWIAQCLESVLMQRTDFPFEVVVGEDCSTDRTRDIVMAYAAKHPDRIRTLPAEANLGVMRNSMRIHQACRGTYHAMIEGDDYWTDPLKLQVQVDFMEAHPDVSLCYHNALILNETVAAARVWFETPPGEILAFAAAYQMTLPVASLLVRADILATLPEWRLKIWCGDLLFRLWCAHHGRLGYVDRIMSVYRRHPGGIETHVRSGSLGTYYDDVVFTCREFDKTTGFVHTELMAREIARMREEHLRQRLRRWYFLRRPRHIVVRIREYADWIHRQKHLMG